LYFLTAIHQPDKGGSRKRTTRTFGYYPTLEEAFNARNNNYGDMHECLYNYLIIENIGAGIHALADEVYWAEWDDIARHWKPIQECPPAFLGIINFAIG
jgi:hypothetical protein